ncbi:hypothetical protein LTR16_002358 [Cryomyces antarcticus]|uniref:ATPase AAA-type core domain-containing protein n=1 Tax=Cryomyces antarcticus TaxID=329879 RepID=A0ABR0LRM7_9PEZI|nr:hypothetical protein LTR16_002358 [Cryomyces antarcticus]
MFIFDRSRRAASSSQYQYGRPSDEELIELTCVGRSTKPIRDLLDYVKIWSLDKERHSLLSAVLQTKRDQDAAACGAELLLEDIDTAGLVRNEKSDERSSGSKAEKNKCNTKDGDNENSEDGKEEGFTLHDLARAIKSSNRRERTSDDVRQGISLSGLLNAIDGVATHEGRVLVMTTNHPEKLDDALIRPGRVDMQVQFGLATRVQTRELFVRRYSSDKDATAERKTTLSSPIPLRHTTPNLSNGTPQLAVSASSTSAKLLDSIKSPSGLQAIADRFAESLPEEKFSPAEIQGFLLTRKKEPQRALREVEGWRDGLLEAKERKRKVLGVQ